MGGLIFQRGPYDAPDEMEREWEQCFQKLVCAISKDSPQSITAYVARFGRSVLCILLAEALLLRQQLRERSKRQATGTQQQLA